MNGQPDVSWPRLARQVIPRAGIEKARALLEAELDSLRRDYFRGVDEKTFREKAIFPDSRWLFILQHRVLARGILSHLLTDSVVALAKSCLPGEIGFFNVAFVRVAYPESTSDGREKLADLTFSPLHRDLYGEAQTITFWTPLMDVNEDTGGLLWTNDPELSEMTSRDISPEQFHRRGRPSDRYLRLLAERTQGAVCSAGDAYYFPRTLWHGSSYCKTRPRMTVDFRLVDVESAERSDPRTNRLVRPLSEFPRCIERRAFIELVGLRDFAFLRRFPASAARACGARIAARLASAGAGSQSSAAPTQDPPWMNPDRP